MTEPYMLQNETAFIAPYLRNKGGLGYVIEPINGRTLTEDEMSVLLSVYSMLLGREKTE